MVSKNDFKNRAICHTNSVVADKDHMLAFNLAKSVCLPPDMEHHKQLTELKAIRSATKSMILAMQKSQIAHKRVLELRKTARQAMAEVEAKTTELKDSQQRTAELKAEVARLTGLVTSANADKQKALIVMKDRYLRELVKLEGKKNAEIAELTKKVNDENTAGFKEGEALYCNNFLQGSDDDEDTETNNTPVVNDQANDQSARLEPTVEDLTTETVLPIDTELPTVTDLPSETGLRVDIDADLDDLFN
ncbi:uncharacterized protein LOC114268821 [Camellia sinensis]|uniref:uncharacterized protein LOC114268821 n=1 Tax=Camellia sinensis TaxID=4442 RepID=UPI0010367EF3|nr:uncharacterized protein LOC114268821 [Camellia sinensis]